MDKFVIESFENGELLCDEMVECDQRLLGERDLEVMTFNRDSRLVFVRRNNDTTSGYYVADDGRWEYGTREDAVNTIKRRI